MPITDYTDFVPWYTTEFPRLVALLRHLGASEDTALDLASEAFARALQRWTRVRRMTSPSGWTFTVGMNLWRRQCRQITLDQSHYAEVSDSSTRDIEVSQDIWRAVNQLPSRQRTAIVLHYLLDLPYSDVARLMGVKAGTIAATLAAARRGLAPFLRTYPNEEATANG
jgi:RNA polymerase sigma factor (sigma-70 family)